MSPAVVDLDWQRLASRFGPCAERLFESLDKGGRSFRAADYAAKIGSPQAEVEELLEELVAHGLLTPTPVWVCQARDCVLDEPDPSDTECPECAESYGQHGRPHRGVQYQTVTPPRRSVPAVLMVHGMNTKGEWQEELARFLTAIHGRSIPIAVYKYGWIVTGVILRWRQRSLTRRLITQLRLISAELEGRPFGNRPDVIAHSFGTWLLYNALETDSTLRVGHVILTGCILPPDALWERFGDRVGPVLNHYGAKDFPTRIAAYVIPEAGPSGRRGFNRQPNLTQVLEPDYGHSGCFESPHRGHVFNDVWEPFLSCPPADIGNLDPKVFAASHPDRAPDWKRVPWLFRAGLVRWLAIVLLLLALPPAISLGLAATTVLLVLALILGPVLAIVLVLGWWRGWDG